MYCSIVEEGLSYRFHASWPFVLQLLGCFYRAAGKHTHPVMTKVTLPDRTKLTHTHTVALSCPNTYHLL